MAVQQLLVCAAALWPVAAYAFAAPGFLLSPAAGRTAAGVGGAIGRSVRTAHTHRTTHVTPTALCEYRIIDF